MMLQKMNHYQKQEFDKENSVFLQSLDSDLSKLNKKNLKKLRKLMRIKIYSIFYLYIISIIRVQRLKKMDISYCKMNSPLFSVQPHSINSQLFRKQFYSLLMISILSDMDKIIDGEVCRDSSKVTTIEKEIHAMRNLFFAMNEFTSVGMITNSNYQSSLITLYEMISLRGTKPTVKPTTIEYIESNIKLIKEYNHDKEISINELIRIGYSLSTNRIQYPSGITINTDTITASKIRRALERLGREIVRDWNKDHSRPLFATIFYESSPKVNDTSKRLQNNTYLQIGIKAIQFADFLICDKKIHRITNQMILWI